MGLTIDEFTDCHRKLVISNVLAVMMSMDAEEMLDILDRQDVDMIYNMIYKEGNNDDETEE